ncbi:uncharacterized protein [Spinacia oleracea]|uniref:Uncharacterized protein n=1 Tax=Spinacia oleracea TaxID=3562 RepID=A0A9R0IPY6_SPIOL|nr:uncharacterized protein LOC110792522 [Spinacia oleracea]
MASDGSWTDQNREESREVEPNEDRLVVRDTSAEKSSAGILSIWHCILTRYLAICANNDGRPKEEEKTHYTMIEIYRHMRHLRLAMNGIENPDSISISEIAKPFNSMFTIISEDEWVEQLQSLMQEVITMRDSLDDIKELLLVTDLNKCVVENDNQPKNLICLLTLWYWFAAWSSPVDQSENLSSATADFMEAIEAQDKSLGFLLVCTSQIQLKEQQQLQIIFSKLLLMLKSDPKHWTDVLTRFIDAMSSTPKAPETLMTSSMHLEPFQNANKFDSISNPPITTTLAISFLPSLANIVKAVVQTAVVKLVVENGIKAGKALCTKVAENSDEILETLKGAAKVVGRAQVAGNTGVIVHY